MQFEKKSKAGTKTNSDNQGKRLLKPDESESLTPPSSGPPVKSDHREGASVQPGPEGSSSYGNVFNPQNRLIGFEVLKAPGREGDARKLGDFLHDRNLVFAGLRIEESRVSHSWKG
jgi:hypothetical protein